MIKLLIFKIPLPKSLKKHGNRFFVTLVRNKQTDKPIIGPLLNLYRFSILSFKQHTMGWVHKDAHMIAVFSILITMLHNWTLNNFALCILWSSVFRDFLNDIFLLVQEYICHDQVKKTKRWPLWSTTWNIGCGLFWISRRAIFWWELFR